MSSGDLLLLDGALGAGGRFADSLDACACGAGIVGRVSRLAEPFGDDLFSARFTRARGVDCFEPGGGAGTLALAPGEFLGQSVDSLALFRGGPLQQIVRPVAESLRVGEAFGGGSLAIGQAIEVAFEGVEGAVDVLRAFGTVARVVGAGRRVLAGARRACCVAW